MKLNLGSLDQNPFLTAETDGVEVDEDNVIVDAEQFLLPNEKPLQTSIDAHRNLARGNKVFLFHNEHPNRAQAIRDRGIKWGVKRRRGSAEVDDE